MKHSITEAKKILVEAILAQLEATKEGNHITANKNSEVILKTIKFIEDEFGLDKMKDLLDHESNKVQVWVAKSLLPIYEDIALAVLEDIGSKDIPHCSLNAKIIISEWKNEPMKF